MKKAWLNPFIFILFFVVLALPLRAQQVENALFWKVSGKSLKQPSYLFGTFHLMGSDFVDSLSVVKSVFDSTEILVGEMVLENSMAQEIMTVAVMKDTTLQDLLSKDVYAETALWLKELAGLDLRMFNQFNPTMIQMLIVTMIQQKINGKTIVPMDLHFQNLARESKRLEGLESLQDQIALLFGKTSFRKQAESLTEFVREKENSVESLIQMNHLYRSQDLNGLMEMFFESSYSTAERNALLDDRNKAWMKKLPGLFEEKSTFVTVGALHLPGENGLVNLLRNFGYAVTPVNLK